MFRLNPFATPAGAFRPIPQIEIKTDTEERTKRCQAIRQRILAATDPAEIKAACDEAIKEMASTDFTAWAYTGIGLAASVVLLREHAAARLR